MTETNSGHTPPALRPGPLAGVREGVRTLHPGYFALVMATGIVSVAMHVHRAYALSVVLLWLAGVAYVVLIALSVARVLAFRSDVSGDLADPRRAFGSFTIVAATGVLGTRLALDGHYAAAFALLAAASLAWLILGYVVPRTAILGKAQRPVLQTANGTWFNWVVASQSIAVLAAALQPVVGIAQRELTLLAVFSWSVGVFLYGAAGLFVAARMLRYP
jgi:tellurite resistance protein TehA-like permease